MSATRFFTALVALVMFGAGVFLWLQRHSERKRVDYLAAAPSDPATVKRGAGVRFAATVRGDNNLKSAFADKPCVAYWTRLEEVSKRGDGEGGSETHWVKVLERKHGPTELVLEVGDWTVEVPLALWKKRRGGIVNKRVEELPKRLGLPAPDPKDNVVGYDVHEVALSRGDKVFVAGMANHISSKHKSITLDHDSRLAHSLELRPGSQDALLGDIAKEPAATGESALVMFGLGVLFLVITVLQRGRK